jgi:hypothetical protein
MSPPSVQHTGMSVQPSIGSPVQPLAIPQKFDVDIGSQPDVVGQIPAPDADMSTRGFKKIQPFRKPG